jgi:hypothetical protein
VLKTFSQTLKEKKLSSKKMSRQHSISKPEASTLYKTIKDIHDLFIKHDISYWATGGTLLGAIRHRGIIPWDDDGDLCMLKKDVPKLRKLIPTFQKKGYIIEEGVTEDETDDEDDEDDEDDKVRRPKKCASKKNSCTWFIQHDSVHGLGVDVFVMERVGPLVTFADPYWRTASNGGKVCYILYKYLFPLVPVRFGNFFIMTPYNAIDHLNQCYGNDWSSMAQRLFDHRTGQWIMSAKRRMLAEDYATIPAPKSTCETNFSTGVSCSLKDSISSSGSDDLLVSEIRLLARLYAIKGRTKMPINVLRKAVYALHR